MARFHLEIRACDTYGSIEGEDTFEGSEQEAMQDAKKWLDDALYLDPYQKEILVINIETEECIYQGTFGLVPHTSDQETLNHLQQIVDNPTASPEAKKQAFIDFQRVTSTLSDRGYSLGRSEESGEWWVKEAREQ